ncbi:cupintype [Diaporthe amygdali]|uniref:cupintype n=1 Tax=Phomopsis amygdali TaxID=1214568 RepID=UPI0022FEC717|nr:cupintype [Diaporthe amygdali]KAJ0108777.1 cupintype [Diaporthe amygdali]
MSDIKIIKTLVMGKGVKLHLMVDTSQPEDSISRYFTEGVVEGKPGDDLFEVPLHWHRNHSEYFEVREGRVQVTIDGVTKIASAGETTHVPAGLVHGFKGFPGERLVVRERSDPPGDYKHLFFADLLSGSWPAGFWHTMRTFYDGDGYPALGLYFKAFDFAFVTLFGGIAKLFLPKRQEKLE